MKIERTVFLLVGAVAAFVISTSAFAQDAAQVAAQNAAQNAARKEFKSPSATYRLGVNVHSVPPTPEARAQKLDQIVAAGYGRIATNVNWTQDYMNNDAELAKFAEFARLAQAKGLEVWLYDENTYPSGMAGDLLLSENPDWEAEGIFFRQTVVAPGAAVERNADGKTRRLAFAVPLDADGDAALARKIDLFANVDDSGKIVWNAPKGDENWLLVEIGTAFLRDNFQSGTVRGPKAWRYTSLLLPEVGRRFVEVTHRRYAEAFGEPLGNVFAATFTDEPSAMAQQFGPSEFGVYPWKQNVSVEYEARTGRRLLDDLPAIALDAGELGRSSRRAYFQIIADFMSAYYFKTIQDFNATQGVASSGHLLLEEALTTHTPLYGDLMACYRRLDVPGVDELTGTPDETRRYLYSSRLASSAAELEGRSDVMCECCPISDAGRYDGKEAPTDSLRGVVDRLLVGGVTKFSDYMTLAREDDAGKRKFNEYVGRIASQTSGGARAADVAVFYPIQSVWAEFRPYPSNLEGWFGAVGGDPEAQRIDRLFRATSDALYDAQREFSYLDERGLLDSRVENGKLVAGRLSWRAVVLPSAQVLSEEAFAKLVEFEKSGGKLIFLERFPTDSTTEFPSKRYAEQVERWRAEAEKPDATNVFFQREFDAAAFDRILASFLTREITFSDAKDVLCSRRVRDGVTTFFIANDSPNDRDLTFVVAPGAADSADAETTVEIWNPTTGEIVELPKTTEPTPTTVRLNGFTGVLIKRFDR